MCVCDHADTPADAALPSPASDQVDSIHEYLLLKGVAAVGIHGGKDQDERQFAITAYRSGAKDVLIGTDIASKVRVESQNENQRE